MSNVIGFLAAGTDTTVTIVIVVVLVLLLVGLFVSNFFASKKQRKVEADTLSSLVVGDEIETRGGIVGKIIAIRERSPEFKEVDILTGSTVITIFAEGFYRVITKANVEMPTEENSNISSVSQEEGKTDFVFGSDAAENEEKVEQKSEDEVQSLSEAEPAEASSLEVKSEEAQAEAVVEDVKSEATSEEAVATTAEESVKAEESEVKTEEQAEEVKESEPKKTAAKTTAAKSTAAKTGAAKKPAAKKTGTSTKSKK